VNVAVSDLNPAPPRERTPDLNGGTGGFGWHMIRRLTSNVTITPAPAREKHERVGGEVTERTDRFGVRADRRALQVTQ
jgi:hypothetical protein